MGEGSYGGAVSEALVPWVRVMYFNEKHGKLFTGWLCVLLTTVWFLTWLLFYPVCLHVLQIVQDVRDRGKKARRDEADEFDQVAALEKKKKGMGYGKTMTATMSTATAATFGTVRKANSRFASEFVGATLSNVGNGDRTLPPHLTAYGRNAYGRNPKTLILYRIKLARELIFLSMAVPSGICLALYAAFSRDPILELLTRFSSAHQVVFTMATGHFCCAILEDYTTRFWLDAGLEIEGSMLFPLNFIYPLRHDKQLHLAYFINHVVEIFAFVFILQTDKLAGLGVHFLLFEVPNLVDLRRRVDNAKDFVPQWLSNLTSIKIYWRLVLAFFLLARGLPISLWIYILVARRHDVLRENFEQLELITYYILVGYFTTFNLRAFVFLLRNAKAEQARLSNFQDDSFDRLGRGNSNWAGLPSSPAAPSESTQKVQCQVQFADLRVSQQAIANKFLDRMDSRYSLAERNTRKSQEQEFRMDLT